MDPALTRHAQARMQQRAIRADALERCYAVLSTGGEILTVGHRVKRISPTRRCLAASPSPFLVNQMLLLTAQTTRLRWLPERTSR